MDRGEDGTQEPVGMDAEGEGMTTSDIAVLLAWVSGVVTAEDACRALGLHQSELLEWEMDAIQIGRLRVAALPEQERVTVYERQQP